MPNKIIEPKYNTPLLDTRSRELRSLIVRALSGGKRGHMGSSMSLVEIIRVLYDNFLKFRPEDPSWEGRDRFILSKGHGCLAQYAVLADKGFFPLEELDRFCHNDGILGGHPDHIKIPGVEASTGALGHGLSIGVGMALAKNIKREPERIVVVTGDGEINEGSIWEAAMCAGNHQLSNLSVLIDYNKIQSYGFTSDVADLEPLAKKWEAFGFMVKEIDGHNISQLQSTFKKLPFDSKKPSAIICHTIKGKGFDIAENMPEWHHKSNLSEEDIQTLLTCLED